MVRKLNSVGIWVPGIFDSVGGIQNYLAHLIYGFQKIIPPENIYVFSKKDTDSNKLKLFSEKIKWHLFYSPKSLNHIKYGFGSLLKSKTLKPDLVVCGHLNFSKAFLPLIYILNSKKWLICYGIESWAVNDFFKNKLLKSVDSNISISHFTRETLVKNYNLNPDLCKILPVSFDEHKFTISSESGRSVRQKLGINQKDKVILTVCRLSSYEKYKGYDKILNIMPKLLKSDPNITYLIVGGGDDVSRVKEMIKQLGVQSKVILTGNVPDDQLCSYYNACDIFCMPSLGEGFGIVYLEAMGCGKTVIGGNQDGTRDALCDGEFGFLVNPHDSEQIHDAILSVLNRKWHHNLAYNPEKLRNRVVGKYGFESFTRKLYDLLTLEGFEVC